MTPEALVLQQTPIITASYVMQVIVSLIIVLAIIYSIARFLLPKLKLPTQGRLIQIVDRIMLEPQVNAYIIKVGKKAWLIASSNKGIEKIDRVEEELS
ncbi:MAG: flagellar biosynthetic protein FliO [Candidatus Margulisbacteria bacterium]|nr:flagellar biosynthetic protein FliO [Candidatus Margulisiibacteriota bacterium]